MTRRGRVFYLYFGHCLFHMEQQHREQSIILLSVTLKWTCLICSTAQYSLETPPSLLIPPSLYLPSSLPPNPLSSSLLPYVYLPYSLPTFFLLSHLPSFSLTPFINYLPLFLPLPLPPPLSTSLSMLFITHLTTYLTAHCTSRFKRVMFISRLQHVDVHRLHVKLTPFPSSTRVHLSLTPPYWRCLRRREKLQ